MMHPLVNFWPDNIHACAAEWEDYKREFLIHLDAKGLHTATGKRQVGQLLKHMGREYILTFDTFTWAPAVEADVANHVEASPAERNELLSDVFAKFDTHFGEKARISGYKTWKVDYYGFYIKMVLFNNKGFIKLSQCSHSSAFMVKAGES